MICDIIQRLKKRMNEYATCNTDYGEGLSDGYEGAIRVVHDVAHEYEKYVCEWMQDDGATDVYDTECGNSHMFIDGSPSDNRYEYCPYCGKKIKVVE